MSLALDKELAKVPMASAPEPRMSEQDLSLRYESQLDASLQQLTEALPDMMPCSDPEAFAAATDQEQAKIIRYLVLEYEKKIIGNTEPEAELAAPFVSSIDLLFSSSSNELIADSEQPSSEPNAEIEQLSNQNRMNQEVIDQFARESREMLNCISTLESENKDLRTLLDEKPGGK
ncbi:MAG: hypothetical protein KUG72_09315 [Pseudomonadales bacterium]|nr:hypothetical protein [Pseudomonadales bacterium]